jgi:hypothetical protein
MEMKGGIEHLESMVCQLDLVLASRRLIMRCLPLPVSRIRPLSRWPRGWRGILFLLAIPSLLLSILLLLLLVLVIVVMLPTASHPLATRCIVKFRTRAAEHLLLDPSRAYTLRRHALASAAL